MPFITTAGPVRTGSPPPNPSNASGGRQPAVPRWPATPCSSTVGWLLLVRLLFLVVSLAPVIAAVWLLSKVTRFVTGQTKGGM